MGKCARAITFRGVQCARCSLAPPLKYSGRRAKWTSTAACTSSLRRTASPSCPLGCFACVALHTVIALQLWPVYVGSFRAARSRESSGSWGIQTPLRDVNSHNGPFRMLSLPHLTNSASLPLYIQPRDSQNLRSRAGDRVRLTTVRDVPSGSFVRFKPQSQAFLDAAHSLGAKVRAQGYLEATTLVQQGVQQRAETI